VGKEGNSTSNGGSSRDSSRDGGNRVENSRKDSSDSSTKNSNDSSDSSSSRGRSGGDSSSGAAANIALDSGGYSTGLPFGPVAVEFDGPDHFLVVPAQAPAGGVSS